jgi:Arc/MetJ-type ribon-helix-helix transcriptional regulator
MTIEIRKPELEQLLREEIVRGHFQSVDDLLTEAIQALREKNSHSTRLATPPRKNLAQFLLGIAFCRV